MVGAPRLWASVMCARQGELEAEIRRLEVAGIDGLHVDIMDGHFVPNLGMGWDAVRAISRFTRVPIAIHAMVEAPERFIGAAASAGARRFIFHIEAASDAVSIVDQIRGYRMSAGVALNPSTSLADLNRVGRVDEVLVMTVEPGFAGGLWIAHSPARVRFVSQARPDARVGVDGHINRHTAPLLWKVGATDFVCGSSGLFFPGSHYDASLNELRQSLADTGEATNQAK